MLFIIQADPTVSVNLHLLTWLAISANARKSVYLKISKLSIKGLPGFWYKNSYPMGPYAVMLIKVDYFIGQ